jgi:hypothetical protein
LRMGAQQEDGESVMTTWDPVSRCPPPDAIFRSAPPGGIRAKSSAWRADNPGMIELVVSPWALGLCLAVAMAYLGVRVLLRALESAPEGFEDEEGFHVTALAPKEDARIWLQSRAGRQMMPSCRPLPPSVSNPTSRPVS